MTIKTNRRHRTEHIEQLAAMTKTELLAHCEAAVAKAHASRQRTPASITRRAIN